ncbi:DUF2111 domain-containing protein [Methanoplanus sp. FWC-SCC4]|uniref:DUF2111 domain-containing protein n=1 Tax=Methanochimaera problematica TaxID=2609417 RepID=A0AA97FEP6_9EURY|nr:DUF2111 domain-containing protein [Methanoplanus sp. FWC-SCC4]WOF16056.1 DUF2111 domain-containing protein [Methanoplanus sp. FWC-SCC4]
MSEHRIFADSDSCDLYPVAMAIHRIVRLPVTARTKNKKGVRIEEGHLIDNDYTGPVLEESIHINALLNTVPENGPYKGVPVIVAPIRDDNGEAIGSIGVVDFAGVFDLATLMEHQSVILKQVCGKDPCPLPTELTGSKR